MKDIKRQCIGMDMAKDDFAVNLSVCNESQEIKHLASRKFQNSQIGFKEFHSWIIKWIKADIPLVFVMEATGVYHEKLACFMVDKGFQLSVVLPKRAKDFSRTLKVKDRKSVV